MELRDLLQLSAGEVVDWLIANHDKFELRPKHYPTPGHYPRSCFCTRPDNDCTKCSPSVACRGNWSI